MKFYPPVVIYFERKRGQERKRKKERRFKLRLSVIHTLMSNCASPKIAGIASLLLCDSANGTIHTAPFQKIARQSKCLTACRVAHNVWRMFLAVFFFIAATYRCPKLAAALAKKNMAWATCCLFGVLRWFHFTNPIGVYIGLLKQMMSSPITVSNYQ